MHGWSIGACGWQGLFSQKHITKRHPEPVKHGSFTSYSSDPWVPNVGNFELYKIVMWLFHPSYEVKTHLEGIVSLNFKVLGEFLYSLLTISSLFAVRNKAGTSGVKLHFNIILRPTPQSAGCSLQTRIWTKVLPHLSFLMILMFGSSHPT
jgi:hypothetical protein